MRTFKQFSIVSKVLIASILSLTLLLITSGGQSAFASAGPNIPNPGKSLTVKPSYNANCPPVTAAFTNLSVFYVNTSGSVNVRQYAGTNNCVVTTQGPSMNVEVLTAFSNGNWYPISTSASGYTWYEVMYYQGNCQTCSNYSFSQTGWIVSSYLTQAHGVTCEVSAGCAAFFEPGGGPEVGTMDVTTQSQCASLSSSGCAWEPQGTYLAATGSASNTWVAPEATTGSDSENWWMGTAAPSWFVWNYDWWAH